MNVPCRPCLSGNEGTCFGRPHHLSVITFSLGRPRSARAALTGARSRISIVRRVHFAAAAAVCFGLRRQRLRAQDGIAVAEEGVRVGDALVGRVRDAQDPLAAADVLEREGEAVDLEVGAGVDERCGVLLVLAVARPAGQPQPVLAPLRRSKGRERERVPRVHLLAVPESLEDRAPWELVGAVAEHRPVRDLARRSTAWPDRVDDAAGAFEREPVEVRRRRGLVPGAAAELGVGAVGEPVQQDHEDRIHGLRLTDQRRHAFGTKPFSHASQTCSIRLAAGGGLRRTHELNRLKWPAASAAQAETRSTT